jgi:hypothetical protein
MNNFKRKTSVPKLNITKPSPLLSLEHYSIGSNSTRPSMKRTQSSSNEFKQQIGPLSCNERLTNNGNAERLTNNGNAERLTNNGIKKRSLTNYELHNDYTNYGLKMFLTMITEAIKRTGKIPKILVIDFDQTITINHTSGMQKLPQNFIDRTKTCLSNINSPENFKQFLFYVKSNNIDIWIASYATTISTTTDVVQKDMNVVYSGKKLIREYLRALYFDNPTDCPIPSDHILAFQPGTLTEGYITACSELGLTPQTNYHKEKNIHLTIIAKRTKITEKDYKTICLIDDDQNNINASNEVFVGINIDVIRRKL